MSNCRLFATPSGGLVATIEPGTEHIGVDGPLVMSEIARAVLDDAVTESSEEATDH